ncbi:MAG: polysaccharide deacetylase family protein [Bacteroidota bacterium]
MPVKIKQTVLRLPRLRGLRRMIEATGVRTIFPFYHTVSDAPDPCITPIYRHRTVKEFESDLDWLCGRFEPVSLETLLSESNSTKPRMVLSFDDGLLSCYELIAPILKKKGIPAQFYLNNDFIGNKGLFYRYLAALLSTEVSRKGRDAEKKEIAHLLNTSPPLLRQALLKVGYPEKDKLEKAASLLGFSVTDYLAANPVYMNEEQIRSLMNDGFEIGGHTADHPMLGELTSEKIIAEIRKSMHDLESRFAPGYRYFAFPFSDLRVPEHVMVWLFEEKVIDAAFGTSGMKEHWHPQLFQRIPMEIAPYKARQIIKGEYQYYLLKKLLRT